MDENRLKHSIAVARKMVEIARSKNLSDEDIKNCFIIGYNHDVGYEFTKKDILVQRTEFSPCQCPTCKRIIDAIDYRDLEDYVVYTGKPRIAD